MNKKTIFIILALLFSGVGIFYYLKKSPGKPVYSTLSRDQSLIRSLSQKSFPTSEYREDIHRTGTDEKNILSLKLKQSWIASTLNVGSYGASKSSPAVDESGVYVGADTGWFYAYDLKGNFRWKFKTLEPVKGIHGTAALDQDRAYIGAYDGNFYALNKKDGRLVWSVKLGAQIGSSPALYNGYIYIGVETFPRPDGFVAKLRCTDGEVIWTSPWLGNQDHSSPVVNEKDGLIYSGANNGQVYAFDLETGKTRWSYNVGGAIKSTSTLVDEVLYISSWAKTLVALKAKTGELIWTGSLRARSRSSPTFVPGLNYLIVGDELSRIFAIRQSDGKTIWSIETSVENLLASPLAIRKNSNPNSWMVWVPCERHYLCALNPANGKIEGKVFLTDRLTGTPKVFKNELFLALDDFGGLLKFVANTGANSDPRETNGK